ncbi:MAG TPA: hypothetical protein VGF75_01315 [Candidatus Saccharimonadales bacterium]|jgi:hypothetical protein
MTETNTFGEYPLLQIEGEAVDALDLLKLQTGLSSTELVSLVCGIGIVAVQALVQATVLIDEDPVLTIIVTPGSDDADPVIVAAEFGTYSGIIEEYREEPLDLSNQAPTGEADTNFS